MEPFELPDTLPSKHPPRVWVSLCAGLVVAMPLAVFSSQVRSELGFWCLVAGICAISAWLLVVVSSLVGVAVFSRLGLRCDSVPCPFRFIGLMFLSLGLTLLLGFLFPLRGLGIGLVLAPLIFFVIVYWTKAQRLGFGTVLMAGALLCVTCVRVFTIPSEKSYSSSLGKVSFANADDVRLLSWDLGAERTLFTGSEENVEKIANVAREMAVQILCLQGVPSKNFLDELLVALGGQWHGSAPNTEGRTTAILSRIGGNFSEASKSVSFGIIPMVMKIDREGQRMQFVSCYASSGRSSRLRREFVDWLLNEFRRPNTMTIVAGNFNIDPERGWTILSPLMSNSMAFDNGTWKSLGILGSDPGLGGKATSFFGRRTNRVVVDSKLELTGYQVLETGGNGGWPVIVSFKQSKEKVRTVTGEVSANADKLNPIKVPN